jgi:hypothetical protein
MVKSDKVVTANVQIKEKAGSRKVDDEGVNVFYLADNDETEALIRHKLLTDGFKGTFKGSEGNDIDEEDIDNLYIYARFNAEYKDSIVYISFNEYLDLVFIKRVNENIVDDSERVRLIMQDYLTKSEELKVL